MGTVWVVKYLLIKIKSETVAITQNRIGSETQIGTDTDSKIETDISFGPLPVSCNKTGYSSLKYSDKVFDPGFNLSILFMNLSNELMSMSCQI